MLTRKTVVLAKIEAAYGTDPVPAQDADAIAVQDLKIGPAGDSVERNVLRGTLSPVRFLRGVKSIEASFKTEMKGTGAPGALPAWGWEGVLLRACGMSETVTGGADIVYAPVSADFASCTLYVYRDRLFHKVTGCRGSFRIAAEAGKPCLVEWKFKGLYQAPEDASAASPVLGNLLPPAATGAALAIGGFGPVAQKIELDIANVLATRKSIAAPDGMAGFEITGRKPQGSFDPEAAAVSAHPFWSHWENAEPLAFSLQVGSAGGNSFRIDAPALQYREIADSDRDGITVYQVPFSLASTGGDDEFTIAFI